MFAKLGKKDLLNITLYIIYNRGYIIAHKVVAMRVANYFTMS